MHFQECCPAQTYWIAFLSVKKQFLDWNKFFRIFNQNFLNTCWFALCNERRSMNMLNKWQLIASLCLIIFLELWNVFFSFRGNQKSAANTVNVLADWIKLSIHKRQRHWQLIVFGFRFVKGDECSLDKTRYLIASKVNHKTFWRVLIRYLFQQYIRINILFCW